MAEDVFQATFLQLHLKCEHYQCGRKLRPWLYRIATNKAIDALRRHRRHRRLSLEEPRGRKHDISLSLNELLEEESPAPEELLEQQELGSLVRRAVAELPEPLRVVVLLVYFQGLKYREAANVLSIPVGTVKSRMHTALTKISHQWRAVEQNDS